MSNRVTENTTEKRTRPTSYVIRAVSLLLIFSLLALTLTACSLYDTRTYTKEEIHEAVETSEEKNYSYSASYFRLWHFPAFSSDKLKAIEATVRRDYYKRDELPGAYALAKTVAALFLNNLYDKIDVTNQTEVTDALITAYVASLGDRYAVYRTADEYVEYNDDMSGQLVGIGVVVRWDNIEHTMTVESVNADSPAEEAGIRPGDKIIKVDGAEVSGMEYSETVTKMRGEVGSTVELTLLRGENELTVTATRKQITENTVTYKINEDKTAYIRITGFKANTADQFISAINAAEEAGVRGIVFDLRSNLGGYLTAVVNMLDYLAPAGTRIVSFSNSDEIYYATSEHRISVPVTVLCNGYTASAAELFTAAIRDWADTGILRARIVGETTYKKGIMQASYPFTDNSALTLTIAYYNPPSGENYDGVGITPDEIVEQPEDATEDLQLPVAYTELKKLMLG